MTFKFICRECTGEGCLRPEGRQVLSAVTDCSNFTRKPITPHSCETCEDAATSIVLMPCAECRKDARNLPYWREREGEKKDV